MALLLVVSSGLEAIISTGAASRTSMDLEFEINQCLKNYPTWNYLKRIRKDSTVSLNFMRSMRLILDKDGIYKFTEGNGTGTHTLPGYCSNRRDGLALFKRNFSWHKKGILVGLFWSDESLHGEICDLWDELNSCEDIKANEERVLDTQDREQESRLNQRAGK